MNKVFLIGYMGAGKSTVGKKLAGKLGYSFVDLDSLIEEECRMTISQIFEKEGDGYFREREREVLTRCFDMEEVVVSLGGGTPCFFDNLQQIQANGVSVYLRMPARMLVHRLRGAKQQRPLLKGMKEPEMLEYIQHHLGEREQFYLRAQLIFNAAGVDIDVLKKLIQENL